jgi:hypothetical protein
MAISFVLGYLSGILCKVGDRNVMAIDVARKGDNYQAVCNSLEKNNLIKRREVYLCFRIVCSIRCFYFCLFETFIVEGSGCMHDEL